MVYYGNYNFILYSDTTFSFRARINKFVRATRNFEIHGSNHYGFLISL